MPPRWPRKPDRKDPAYRKLDDRMNFAIHVAVFGAIDSGLWFVHIFKNNTWSWLTGFTCVWLAILLLHLIYITAIANYTIETNG